MLPDQFSFAFKLYLEIKIWYFSPTGQEWQENPEQSKKLLFLSELCPSEHIHRYICLLFCSSPSSTTRCRRAERFAIDWTSCTFERPSWTGNTMDEHSGCPTLRTQTWSGETYLHTHPEMFIHKVYERRWSWTLLSLVILFPAGWRWEPGQGGGAGRTKTRWPIIWFVRLTECVEELKFHNVICPPQSLISLPEATLNWGKSWVSSDRG